MLCSYHALWFGLMQVQVQCLQPLALQWAHPNASRRQYVPGGRVRLSVLAQVVDVSALPHEQGPSQIPPLKRVTSPASSVDEVAARRVRL